MQDVLTFAIEAVTVGFGAFMVADLAIGLAARKSRTEVAVEPVVEAAEPEFVPNADGLVETTEAETEVDPWDVEIEPIATAVLPLFTDPPRLLLLPAGKVQDWQKMSAEQLRKECQARQIRWRNANGKRHLTKQQMIKALSA